MHFVYLSCFFLQPGEEVLPIPLCLKTLKGIEPKHFAFAATLSDVQEDSAVAVVAMSSTPSLCLTMNLMRKKVLPVVKE